MTRTAGQTQGATLAEDMKQAAQRPDLDAEIRSLLDRCYRALIESDATSVASSMHEEYESIARMIEAEASAWPEDVERLASLAARVRNWVPGG